MRTLVLVLAFLGVACAQVPEYVDNGSVFCGAVRRGSTDIQVWCRLGSSSGRLINNQLVSMDTTRDGKVILPFNYPKPEPSPDPFAVPSYYLVHWTFAWNSATKVMTYECAMDLSMKKTGRLF